MDVLIDGEIVLYGTVGESLWSDGFAALDVLRALATVGRAADVTVRLNSAGGLALEGAAIYSALAAHPGTVTVVVEGVAASAASLIAMAGDEIVMRPGSVMMIHDPAAATFGDSATHQKTIEGLEALAVSYAGIYADKAGLTAEEARADMVEETWFTPQQAVDRGYADRIGDSTKETEPTAFNYRLFNNTPEHFVALADERGWAKPPRTKAAMSAATHRRHREKSMATDRSADSKSATTNDSSQADQQAQRAAELDRAKMEASAQARADERARIAAIMALDDAKGRDDLARHFAHKTDMTAAQAQAALAAAPKAAAAPVVEPNRLDAAMRAAGEPRVGADAPAETQDDPAAEAAAIVTMFRGPSVKRSA